MKINNITALDYSASGERLVLSLSSTTMEEITGIDTSLVTIQTDAGDTVEVFAGYSLKSVTYDVAASTYLAILERNSVDGTKDALDALAAQIQEQAVRQDEIMAALAELGTIVAGGTV